MAPSITILSDPKIQYWASAFLTFQKNFEFPHFLSLSPFCFLLSPSLFGVGRALCVYFNSSNSSSFRPSSSFPPPSPLFPSRTRTLMNKVLRGKGERGGEEGRADQRERGREGRRERMKRIPLLLYHIHGIAVAHTAHSTHRLLCQGGSPKQQSTIPDVAVAKRGKESEGEGERGRRRRS